MAGWLPLYYVVQDVGTLCSDCAIMAESEGLTDDPDDTQWYIVACAINWEDTGLHCDHCNKRIEFAYGEDSKRATE